MLYAEQQVVHKTTISCIRRKLRLIYCGHRRGCAKPWTNNAVALCLRKKIYQEAVVEWCVGHVGTLFQCPLSSWPGLSFSHHSPRCLLLASFSQSIHSCSSGMPNGGTTASTAPPVPPHASACIAFAYRQSTHPLIPSPVLRFAASLFRRMMTAWLASALCFTLSKSIAQPLLARLFDVGMI